MPRLPGLLAATSPATAALLTPNVVATQLRVVRKRLALPVHASLEAQLGKLPRMVQPLFEMREISNAEVVEVI